MFDKRICISRVFTREKPLEIGGHVFHLRECCARESRSRMSQVNANNTRCKENYNKLSSYFVVLVNGKRRSEICFKNVLAQIYVCDNVNPVPCNRLRLVM